MKVTMNLLIASLICLVSTSKAFASKEKITCTTPRESRKLIIQKNAISMTTPLDFGKRGLASMNGIRTRIRGKGFTKIMFLDGKKFSVHIKNQNSFSDVEDYMTVRSKEGHEMTYPLTCSNS